MNFSKRIIVIFVLFLLNGCAMMTPKWKSIQLTNQDLKVIRSLNIEEIVLKKLIKKPLYKFSEKELDIYLGYLYLIEPDLRERVQHLARKCVNQPYQIFLLGEFPAELYDPDPLYSLKQSDCVVFSEHIYAMALSFDWKSFFTMLQRIRYKNGEISLLRRNHYTELDWDINNSWLVEDICEQLIGDHAVKVTSYYDRASFFKNWGIQQNFPKDTLNWYYVPYELVLNIMNQLKPGDFVNVVRGNDSLKWVGHVGLITQNTDGTINFLHSVCPKVREEPLLKYVEDNLTLNEKRKLKNQTIKAYNEKLKNKQSKKSFKQPLPYFYGFKFLRLRHDPIWELIKIDGPNAPKVSIPALY